MPTQKPSVLIIALVVFAVANLLALNAFAVVTYIQGKQLVEWASRPTNSQQAAQQNGQKPDGVCAPGCIELIESATAAAALAKSSTTAGAAPSSTPTTIIQVQQAPAKTLVSYVPFGTGSTTNNEWQDISGAESYINTADYGTITDVRFDASLHMDPANGTVYARLYNVTDSHPVWGSEVSAISSASTFQSSSKIVLDGGNKLYRVQMKSSIQYPAFLDSSRVKITHIQ